MASNSFGNILRMTTWGESHGKAIGVVIDGFPSGIPIDEEMIQSALSRRAPGKNLYTSPRKENDRAEILSGIFEGVTTGTPISVIIYNHDQDSSKYESIKNLLRPGHANYTYLKKYGIFDYRGAGRSSGRETACRVIAGAIAKQLLHQFNIHVIAYVKQISEIEASIIECTMEEMQERTFASPVFCPDERAAEQMIEAIERIKQENDSLGGVVEFIAHGVPVGLGDPIYQKLEANLAVAMMSIPATKSFEIGAGFASIAMRGSQHNDEFVHDDGMIKTKTNHAGGVLGGISTGMPIVGRVGFKPTSSIMKEQNTVNIDGQQDSFFLPQGSRHDPCIVLRAVPVVDAMASFVLADAFLANQCR